MRPVMRQDGFTREGVANPDVMPVEVKTPKSIDETGTNNQPKQDNEYVQLPLFTV